jgi:ankyrin repeat protein
MLDKVLEMEADVNVIDTNGWSPVHHAAYYGELDAIKILLSRGASLDIFSNKGYYAIHVAASNN